MFDKSRNLEPSHVIVAESETTFEQYLEVLVAMAENDLGQAFEDSARKNIKDLMISLIGSDEAIRELWKSEEGRETLGKLAAQVYKFAFDAGYFTALSKLKP